MDKTQDFKGASMSVLHERKILLLSNLSVPVDLMRASYVRQYLTCGKSSCRCGKGHKHGPCDYLVQCLGIGKVQKFLLRTPEQRTQARAATRAYLEFQERVEELSRINTELLRRA